MKTLICMLEKENLDNEYLRDGFIHVQDVDATNSMS